MVLVTPCKQTELLQLVWNTQCKQAVCVGYPMLTVSLCELIHVKRQFVWVTPNEQTV